MEQKNRRKLFSEEPAQQRTINPKVAMAAGAATAGVGAAGLIGGSKLVDSIATKRINRITGKAAGKTANIKKTAQENILKSDNAIYAAEKSKRGLSRDIFDLIGDSRLRRRAKKGKLAGQAEARASINGKANTAIAKIEKKAKGQTGKIQKAIERNKKLVKGGSAGLAVLGTGLVAAGAVKSIKSRQAANNNQQ